MEAHRGGGGKASQNSEAMKDALLTQMRAKRLPIPEAAVPGWEQLLSVLLGTHPNLTFTFKSE